jgi:hypothetical protein
MQRTSLNCAVTEETSQGGSGTRAINGEMNGSFRVRKGREFGRVVRYGVLGVAAWLLLVPARGAAQASQSSIRAPQASSSPINLLSPRNGGQVVVATNDGWLKTIDGNETRAYLFTPDDSAVFAFKNERPAIFDTFAMLIPGKGNNVKEFELLAGTDSPTGDFDSIGRFQTVNAKVIKSPYQEFKFAPVTAKYIKLQPLAGWNNNYQIEVWQLRLFGRLQE